MVKRYAFIKVDLDFRKDLEKIKLERIKIGRDRRMRSDRRITMAIHRHSLSNNIWKDIINSDLTDE